MEKIDNQRQYIRLDQLHSVLQVAMGWSNCHLHQYRVGRSYAGIPDPDFDMDVTDERKVYLQDIISSPKDNFVYEYDFGDGWGAQNRSRKNSSFRFF